MISLNLLGIQRLIWSLFRSFRVILVKRRQNYLHYKQETLLEIALSFFGTQSETVWASFYESWLLRTARGRQQCLTLSVVHLAPISVMGVAQHSAPQDFIK